MGRIGALFRKSSDKEKSTSPSSSNPYAQQPTQHSPPPGYDQYNQNQYNGNQYHTATSQNTPSGLPAGPRPGGLPSRVAPGPPSQTKSFESTKASEQPPPPRYSPTGSQLPPYSSPTNGSSSAGGSPALASIGSGYSREKLGAQDGFGKNRYDSTPSPYGGDSATRPSQRPGGYGNLDTESGGLFVNYRGPSRPNASPNHPQIGSPDLAPATSEMTEQERQDAEVEGLKAQIEEGLAQTNESGYRSLGHLAAANERMEAMNGQLRQDWEVFQQIKKQTEQSNLQAEVGNVNLDHLDAANTSIWNFVANSKSRIAAREEKKIGIQQRYQMTLDEVEQEGKDIDQRWEAEQRRREGAKPKELLGAANKKKVFAFEEDNLEFEDDSGRQRAMNDEYREITKRLASETQRLKEQAEFQGFMLEQQNKEIDHITERMQTAGDRVAKNQFRMDVKYNKKR